MKKLFLLTTFLFCLIGMVEAQPITAKQTDLERQGLKGNVRTMTEKSRDVSGNRHKNIFYYNKHGNITELQSFSNGLLTEKITCRYDDLGAITEEIGKYETKEYVYDSLGYKVKTMLNGNPYLRHENTMEDGQLKQIATYNTENNLTMLEEYNYTDSCTTYSCTYYNASVNIVITSRYDKNGNLLEQSSNAAMPPDVFVITYRYDENGTMVERSNFSADSPEQKSGLVYKYNDYDKAGNWIKQMAYSAKYGDLHSVLEREFTYRKY